MFARVSPNFFSATIQVRVPKVSFLYEACSAKTLREFEPTTSATARQNMAPGEETVIFLAQQMKSENVFASSSSSQVESPCCNAIMLRFFLIFPFGSKSRVWLRWGEGGHFSRIMTSFFFVPSERCTPWLSRKVLAKKTAGPESSSAWFFLSWRDFLWPASKWKSIIKVGRICSSFWPRSRVGRKRSLVTIRRWKIFSRNPFPFFYVLSSGILPGLPGRGGPKVTSPD